MQLALRGIHNSNRWSQHDLCARNPSSGATFIHRHRKGTGRAWVLPKLSRCLPSATTMPCRPQVPAHAHAQAQAQAQTLVSENKTNCQARRGDDERLLRGKQHSQAQPFTESRREAFPSSVQQSHKDCQVNRRAGSKEPLPATGSSPIRPLTICLTRFVSGPGGGGKSTEHATYRQGDSLGWLHRSGVATACNALQQRFSFSCRFVYTTPPQDRLQHHERFKPRGSPSHEHGFGFHFCGEPNRLPTRPYRPRGNNQTEATVLARPATQCSSFPVCIRPVKERCEAGEPLISLGDCNGKQIGYGGPVRVWGSCTRWSSANLLEHALDQATRFP